MYLDGISRGTYLVSGEPGLKVMSVRQYIIFPNQEYSKSAYITLSVLSS